MTFRVYRSNRVERLVDALEGVVRSRLQSPFARECIAVQGPGMERWLSSRLAEQLGVWANPWFPFPRAVVELVLDAMLGPVAESSRWYRPEALSFRIAQRLPSLCEEPSLRGIAGHLEGDVGGERLLEIAGELARSYDQCLVYRPDLVLGWERGEGDDLHAVLWRSLSRGETIPHLAARLSAFDQASGRGDRLKAELPERIALFGISALPPAFLSVLSRASQFCDVHFFLLTPSQEYWGDLDQKLARGHDLHALLATLGKVGRDLIEQLAELPNVELDEELFEAPEGDTVLSGLVADLATLTSRGEGGELRRSARASDGSLAVHVCHSELRELEVLRDQLRARLEADPTLMPQDIVVLTPDIERYASFVHAVFAPAGEDDKSALPYHVADRKAAALSPVGDAFLRLAELTRTRLALSDVLDLLHRPAVRTRFGLAEEELDRVESWLTEAGARWAIDAAHRKEFEQPAVHENTLAFALERLLVGYASAEGERLDFAGSLPFADAEGKDAAPLGGLSRYLRTLFECVRGARGERTMRGWAEELGGQLERMISSDEELGSEHVLVRSLLAELASEAEREHFTSEVSHRAFVRLLRDRLEARRSSGGFLAGGITFCEHVPMRAIPFRVVCLLGMDDEAFPRRARPSAFDVLSRAPRRGDRTLRDDDRQIFLETLLSARDSLWMSYVGRSAKDDAVRPASVLVDQLLSLCDRHFVLSSDGNNLRLGFEGSVRDSITHVHALQRFEPRYFKDPRHPAFFSYDVTALHAARVLFASRPEPLPFVTEPLPPVPRARELDIEQLVRFFRAPPRAFLEERLGVFLPRDKTEVPDREPTSLLGLDRYRVADVLLREMIDVPREEKKRILRQEGRLPPGTLGDVAYAVIERSVDAVQRAVPAEDEQQVKVRVELEGTRIIGRLGGVAQARRVERIISVARGKHLLSAWIRHLALCASEPVPCTTQVVSRDAKRGAHVSTFVPVSDAKQELEKLVGLRALGLAMPLPFFPGAGFDAAKIIVQGKDEIEARGTLEKRLSSVGFGAITGELEERPVRQLWPQRALMRPASLAVRDAQGNELDAFALVRLILVPMLRHLAEGEA